MGRQDSLGPAGRRPHRQLRAQGFDQSAALLVLAVRVGPPAPGNHPIAHSAAAAAAIAAAAAALGPCDSEGAPPGPAALPPSAAGSDRPSAAVG